MYLALCCYCPAFFFCDFWSRFSIALVIALKEAPRTAFADFPRTMLAKLFLKLQLDFLESADRSPLISACNLFALTLERAFGRKTGDFLLSILDGMDSLIGALISAVIGLAERAAAFGVAGVAHGPHPHGCGAGGAAWQPVPPLVWQPAPPLVVTVVVTVTT